MSTEPTIDQADVSLDDTTERSGTTVRRGAFAAAAGGVAAAAAALFASGRSSGGPTVAAGSRGAAPAAPAVVPAPRQQAPSEADLALANVAAGLEILAVGTYQAALDAAGANELGVVPPAVAEFVTTARRDHQAALDAWNGVLTSAGKPAVSAPPAELADTVNQQFARVTDAGGAAQLALMLEQVAADTYLDAISKLSAPAAISLAGSIYPIDRQHISVLLFALGMYPVPQTFADTSMAYSGSGGMSMSMMPETR